MSAHFKKSFLIKILKVFQILINFKYIHLNFFFYVKGVGTTIWSPLASGILTGKYDDGVPIYSRAALKVSNYCHLSLGTIHLETF